MNNKTPVILVTGANGQLGRELRDLAPGFPQYRFIFTSKEELAIDDHEAVTSFFNTQEISCCINCAAYTAVDKAESEKEKAFAINAGGTAHLARTCYQHHVKLIHISTDYVFDGTGNTPYKEIDPTDPINVYGASKRSGEVMGLRYSPFLMTVIRTSWLYSSYGNNFVKTMVRLMKEKDLINVVNDQYGCPTYAADLASAIMKIIDRSLHWPDLSTSSGIYHYCNSGVITWYEFALAIKEITGSNCIINPIPTSQYPTAAKRPQYAVLDTTAIQQSFDISIPGWRESLEECLKRARG